jgi:hypothetical protein
MNEREAAIVKAILTFLNRLDGGQAVETIIHASAQTEFRNRGEAAPSFKEMSEALKTCDQRGWVTGVAAKITKQMKWSLSDEGRAALLEI